MVEREKWFLFAFFLIVVVCLACFMLLFVQVFVGCLRCAAVLEVYFFWGFGDQLKPP